MNCKGIEWLGARRAAARGAPAGRRHRRITTMSCIPAENRAKGDHPRQGGRRAGGLSVAERVFAPIDPAITLTPQARTAITLKRAT